MITIKRPDPKDDFIKRFVDKDTDGVQEYSPMDPPKAYEPTGSIEIEYETLAPFLKHLADEHKKIQSEVAKFESALLKIRNEGVITNEINKQLSDFFRFLDEEIVFHHLKEERILFPALHDKLIEVGEHATMGTPETAVDMLEDDHIKTMQLTTLCFSLMGISSRIQDATARTLLIDTALEQGSSLVELLKLHIFREENVVFGLVQKHFSTEELAEMESKMQKYFAVAI